MHRAKLPALVAAGLIALATPAAAATVLGFERINASYPSTNFAQILSFYGGGTSSQATSGPNFGITFAANAVAACMNPLAGHCSTASRNGTSPTSGQGGLEIASGTSTYLDFASAYTGAIAFRYQVAPGFTASIAAFDGLGGTGTQLTPTLLLFTTAGPCPAYNAIMCNLGPGGLGFVSGAKSIVFSGAPGKFVFDDLTFGAGNDPLPPPPFASVPEPATWSMLLAGFAVLGAVLRRRGNPVRRLAV